MWLRPVALACCPQRGRNPLASISPNKPGRPLKGQMSKAAKRAKKLEAEEEVAIEDRASALE